MDRLEIKTLEKYKLVIKIKLYNKVFLFRIILNQELCKIVISFLKVVPSGIKTKKMNLILSIGKKNNNRSNLSSLLSLMMIMIIVTSKIKK